MQPKVIRYRNPKTGRRTWWIEGVEPYLFDGEGPYCRVGPYATAAEAREDCRGIRLFLELCQEEGIK